MDYLKLPDECRPGRTLYNKDENPVVKCLRKKGQDAVDSLKEALDSGLDFDSCCYGLILAAFLGNYEVVETFIQHSKELSRSQTLSQKTEKEDWQDTSDFIWDSPQIGRRRSLLNNYNDHGHTALLSAICGGHIEICRLLLREGADINLPYQMSRQTPLIVAIEHGNDDIVKLLIDSEADVQLCDNVGITPLYTAIKSKKEKLVQWLLDAECDINIGSQDHSPLFLATRLGQLNIVQMLCKAGCFKDITNKYNVTPVYEAALKGHHNVLKYLLEVGCNPNIVDMYCQSPLHIAVMSGHLKCVKLLIEGGANIKLRNHNRDSPIDLSLQMGRADILQYFMEEGLDVIPDNGTPTKLKYIVALFECGYCEALEVLLRGCANLKMLHCIGVLPLFRNNVHLLKLLLHSGIETVPSNLSSVEKQGNKDTSEWLKEFKKTPRTLKDTCRLCVRRNLGNKILYSVKQLPLPTEIKAYITLNPL